MPVVPVLPSIITGVYPTSTPAAIVAFNTFLLNKPRARIRQSATQSYTTGSIAAVQFDTHDFDTDPDGIQGHSDITNNTRWTCRYPGTYQFSGGVGWAPSAVGARSTRWSINGSALTGGGSYVPATAAGGMVVLAKTMLWPMNIGDYVELLTSQSSGGTISTSNIAELACTMEIVWHSA